ncbi:tetratricopeptide repeat protein [Desulfonatronum parangueonense]
MNPSSLPLPPGAIKGVFSTNCLVPVGFGHTKKNTVQNIQVYAVEQEDDQIAVQSLNDRFMPTGSAKLITKEELLKNYHPEPDVYLSKVIPVMREVEKGVARGERHLQNKETFSAEMEFKNVLRIDEENIRATFGLGQCYLSRGDRERGDIVFRRLVRLKGAFQPCHKHMFNEFGIALRKNDMFVQALKYYARALPFSKDDENLMFNMSRIFHEKGSNTLALKFVNKALKLNPAMPEANQFKLFLEQKLRR